MKILLLQSSSYIPSLGGANKANRLLLEQLAARGHECHVAGTAGGERATAGDDCLAGLAAAGVRGAGLAGPGVAAFRHAGVEVEAVLDGARLRAHAAGRLRELAPDRVLVSSEDPAQMLLEEAVAVSPHTVYLAHTTLHLPFGPDGFLQSPGRTGLLRRTAGIVAVSGYVREYVRRWAGLESTLLRFPVYGAGPYPALGDFGRGFVTLINPCAVKGISIFLELARRLPDVSFAAVPTWGTTVEDLEALAALPNVRLLAPAANVDEIFAETRVLLVPSLWGEAFGQVAVEAMLRGIPVLASDAGGLPEAKLGVDYVLPVRPIERYEERFDERKIPLAVVPAQDLAPWESALRAVLGDRGLYDRLARESRQAAHAFVAGLGTGPFEEYLERLPARLAADAVSETAETAARPADMGHRLAGLSAEKLELLARRLRKKDGPPARQPEIPRLERPGGGGAFPLSFTQARMWFMHQLAPETPFYNESFGSRLRGRLCIPALAAGLREIVRRHEVLRTRFASEEMGGEPVQVVSAEAGETFGGLAVIDLGALPRPMACREAERLAGDEKRRPFDLARGPLLRASVLRLAPGEHHLVIVVHHITADMWAIGIMMRELSALYAAFRAGRPAPPLPALPIQYADFAVWQRQWLTGERLDGLLAWWRGQLAGMPPLLELPGDRPRPAFQSFRGASLPVVLSAPLGRSLRELARRGEATLFMALLAGFQALLHRATGQDDLAVGTPIANRGRRELEGLIGCFINSLVLRGDLSGRPTGRELLARTRSAALGAYAHQDLPFELLVERLQPERSLSHGPLFQVMFLLQNTPESGLDLPELATEALPLPEGVAKLDLLLALSEAADGTIHGSLDTSRDLFDPPTAARLLAHLIALLDGMAADPGRRIDELPLLSAAERHQLLKDWNDTATDYGPDRPGLHELFERQARRTPGAPAAVFEGRTLTYAELDARAGRLAGELRALGCGPESRVGVAMERSLELVVALLAALKAGAAYVPLDPEYPADRLAFMLEDARPAVLITQRHLLAALPPFTGAVLLLDEELAGRPESRSQAPLHDLQLAYVIYTSGSTGRPKGAMVHHGGIRNRLLWMQEAYRLGPPDTVLQKTPFSFDVSVWEFFWPLLAGARLVLARPGEHRDAAALVDLIRRERVTVLHFVPSMLQAFLEEPGCAGCDSLRLVVASGEALSPELVRRFYDRLGEHLPGVDLQNLYGPTEASVDVTFAGCGAGRTPGRTDAAAHRSIPIGRPVANTRIHLSGIGGEPAPIGVAGELCIGGVQVGRGYLDRPALTAEKIVPDPFGEPGARLYRTGDLARRRPDGTIEFLGRIDHQVKIRGFRIELGEIEAALAALPAVGAALVMAQEGRLVAYVTPASEGLEIDPGALRDALRATLPEPMVPSAFVVLAAFPLTPNGKVDRRALPAPGAPERPARSAFIGPRTSAEAAVSAVWSELLRAPEIGAEDNFFDLGGDSIQAVRLVSRVNQRLGAKLRVQDVFRHQTVAALAAQVDATRERRSVEDERAAGLERIESLRAALLADPDQRRKLPADWEDVYPLSGIEKGMIYYSLLMPEEPVYHDQTAHLIELRDTAAFFHAFALLVRRHPVFRSGFHLDDFGEPMKVVRREIRLEEQTGAIEDLSALPVDERRQRIDRYRGEDLARRFTFDGAPLWRLKLFRLEGGLHASVWTWHHALLDGWSNISFWVELAELCARPDLGTLRELPPLGSSYKDYVAITLGRTESAATAAFWRRVLDGAGRNKLPFNRSAARRPHLRGMPIEERSLPSELLSALRARALEHHVSLQAVFLAAHLWLLHATSGEDDVVTGVVSHDRPGLPDADRVLGCFLSTFPVRLDVGRQTDAGALLRAVSAYLAAEKEHEIPLAEIAVLAGLRDTSDNPLFDTLLNYMNFHVAEAVGAGSIFPAEDARRAYPLRSQEMTNTLLDVEVSTTRGELLLRIKSSPKHFDPLDVDRAATLYARILEQIAADPAAPLTAARLLSAAEREEIVVRFNDTARPFPREMPLHGFFEEQAARAPEAVAVLAGSAGGESLTYGALDERANRLAHHLIRRGVAPGDNVGLCCWRSLDLAVGALAILKAGAAYVPLEPEYPAARKSFILRQSAAARLLADRRYDLDLSPGEIEEVETILFSEVAESGEAARPARRPLPESLAYTIYTSGSTGRPKGVMIEHAAAVSLVAWVNRAIGVGPDDRLLMVSSVCFDLSVYDLFGGLAAGAAVVIAGRDDLRDPARLDRLMRDERITFWSSTPSTLAHLVKHLEESEPEAIRMDLRTVLLSGDWIPLSLPDRIRRIFPAARVISLGGATEATVWSNVFFIDRVDADWASIPYGRPIDNTSFYILDRRLDPVPPGVVGELYIGGAGVARGYAGDPERTAVSFLPDPFAAGRMYRTGDFGRMLPEGGMEFLGRADHQVKIRGFRVELGEIESRLRQHPAVREAVVVDRTDRSGEKLLCAYIAAAESASAAELRAWLAGALPEYMIPAAFVSLPALPLTANGKIDRRALPDPEAANLRTGAEYAAPSNDLEAALVEIWSRVLGLEGIGVRHDFFEIGGHSLSAVRVLTQIRRRFGVDLPLRELFEAATIEQVARAIAARDRERSGGLGEPVIPPRSGAGPAPLSYAQERLWFLYLLEPESPAFHLGGAVRLSGALVPGAFAASLGATLRRHEVLRTRFLESADGPVQVIDPIAPSAPIALPFVDLGGLPGAARERELRLLGDREMARPFDLARDWPLRVHLVRLAPQEHAALFTLHHIAGDGWSLGLLIREVGALYAAFAEERPLALPELPVQYADFAAWQRGWLSGERLESQLAWWRERLAGPLPVLHLPQAGERPETPSFRGAACPVAIPAGLRRRLEEIGHAEGATIFMTLLAGFKALLRLYSGQEDLIVGTNVANRDRGEVEGLIGFFVNNLALRTDLSGDPGFRELVRRVRDVSLGAFAHQEVPFERVLEAVQPRRQAVFAPLFQVMFVLQNFPATARQAGGLEITLLELPARTANFDLTLMLSDEDGELKGALLYDTDLFEEAAMVRMTEHFLTVLESAAGDPDRPLSSIRITGEADLRQLTSAFSEDF